MGIWSRLFGKDTSTSGQPGSAEPEAAVPIRPAKVSTLDAAKLAHFEESLRERAQVVFLTTSERLEEHDGLATDISSEEVLAMENLGYDNSEGHDLATEAARAAGAPGYVFFHAQDAARLIDGPGTLHLRYAAAHDESTTAVGKEAEDEVVGRQVAAALEAEGLTATWDGSAQSTITIQDLLWCAAPGPGSPVA